MCFARVFSIPNSLPLLRKLLLVNCRITTFAEMTFENASSLVHLDLSYNLLTGIKQGTFAGLQLLTKLNLRGNRNIQSVEPYSFLTLASLPDLSISDCIIHELLPNTFSGLKLETLDISNNHIQIVHRNAFNNLSVRKLDFRETYIQTFDSDIFSGMENVEKITASAFKFCCYKPTSVCIENCLPNQDEFSSCADLMRNSFLQIVLWAIGTASLVGNVGTIIYRIFYERDSKSKSFGLFVTNLAASDFLMGVYMIIVAVADVSFRGRYDFYTIWPVSRERGPSDISLSVYKNHPSKRC